MFGEGTRDRKEDATKRTEKQEVVITLPLGLHRVEDKNVTEMKEIEGGLDIIPVGVVMIRLVRHGKNQTSASSSESPETPVPPVQRHRIANSCPIGL
jgi:hypothetical protein